MHLVIKNLFQCNETYVLNSGEAKLICYKVNLGLSWLLKFKSPPSLAIALVNFKLVIRSIKTTNDKAEYL